MTPVVMAVAALGAMGCVDGDRGSILIAGQATLDDECIVQHEPLQTTGILDVAVSREYLMHLVVYNQLRAGSRPWGADPNGIHFDAAEVRIVDAWGEVLLDWRPYIASGFVPPSEDGQTPGEGSVVVPIDLTGVELGGLPETTHFTVRLFGETNGEHSLSTGPWSHTVRLCSQCLVCGPDAEPASCLQGQDYRCYEWLGGEEEEEEEEEEEG